MCSCFHPTHRAWINEWILKCTIWRDPWGPLGSLINSVTSETMSEEIEFQVPGSPSGRVNECTKEWIVGPWKSIGIDPESEGEGDWINECEVEGNPSGPWNQDCTKAWELIFTIQKRWAAKSRERMYAFKVHDDSNWPWEMERDRRWTLYNWQRDLVPPSGI